jgi:hypothetical protein
MRVKVKFTCESEAVFLERFGKMLDNAAKEGASIPFSRVENPDGTVHFAMEEIPGATKEENKKRGAEFFKLLDSYWSWEV